MFCPSLLILLSDLIESEPAENFSCSDSWCLVAISARIQDCDLVAEELALVAWPSPLVRS